MNCDLIKPQYIAIVQAYSKQNFSGRVNVPCSEQDRCSLICNSDSRLHHWFYHNVKMATVETKMAGADLSCD